MTLEQQLEQAAERGAARAFAALLSQLPTSTPQPLLHTVTSASKRLGGIGTSQVRKLVNAGELKTMPRVEGEKILIPDAELVRYATQVLNFNRAGQP